MYTKDCYGGPTVSYTITTLCNLNLDLGGIGNSSTFKTNVVDNKDGINISPTPHSKCETIKIPSTICCFKRESNNKTPTNMIRKAIISWMASILALNLVLEFSNGGCFGRFSPFATFRDFSRKCFTFKF